MEFILIIGIFEALFLAGLIFTQKKKSLSDHILGIFFLVYALNFALSYLEFYNRINGFPYPFFLVTAPPIILLHGPALWFYVKSLTDQNFRFRSGYLLHFLPFALMMVGLFFHVYSLPAEAKIKMVQDGSITDHLVYKIFVVAIALSTTGYSIWGLAMVLRYNKKIKTYFSHIEKIDLSWLKILLAGAIIVYGIINTVYIIDLFIPVASFGAMQFFSFVFGAVYIIFLGFFGLQQGNLFASQKINMNLEEAVEQHKTERNAGGKDEKFVHFLLEHMKEEKPYLNSDLNISKLSRELDVTPEYLSKLINTKLNKNFFDFVNRYRVNEFKECCKNSSHQNLSLIGLAYNCGFNSKATFNRVFKNIAGVTPSEYYKQVSEK